MKKLSNYASAPLGNIQINGGFWGRLMEVNRRATLPIQYKQCKETGRIDALKLNWKPGQPNEPHIFWDSDIGKWIEAVAYSLVNQRDASLEQLVDDVIELIAKAQQPDGYLNTHFTVVAPAKRWTNLRDWHELYCAGHLIEGAVAYYEATGKRQFLDVMCRYADYIASVFGRKAGQKRGYCGHEEIELALIKLHRVTSNQRYLDLARYFIDERGQQPHYFDIEARARGEEPSKNWWESYAYAQAHVPVRELAEVGGHSVRAMYLYSGMTDVATATGDPQLWQACRRLWDNVVYKRMHVTGGLGPTHANEGFTVDYDLPNEGAYLETCAAIGLVFWAQRMVNADLNGEYADVMERALYNGTISGVSHDGKKFFYGNPLATQPGFDGNGRFVGKDYNYSRSEWFGCACCPPNIARMIAQFPTFLYSTRANELAVHLFAQSQGTVSVAGQTVRIAQETEYPWDGKIRLTLTPEKSATWTLALRIPGWCRGATLRINGKVVALKPRNGYAILKRTWQPGDQLDLNLPMPVDRVEAHPAARQDCGRVALQRGPVVYCLEQPDNGQHLNDVLLGANPKFTIRRGRSGLLKNIPLIQFQGWRRKVGEWKNALYRPQGSRHQSCRVTAIPYYLWANRKAGEMLVWIRQAAAPRS